MDARMFCTVFIYAFHCKCERRKVDGYVQTCFFLLKLIRIRSYDWGTCIHAAQLSTNKHLYFNRNRTTLYCKAFLQKSWIVSRTGSSQFYLPPTKEEVYVFARARLFVCLSVCKITQKRVHGFGWNVACRQVSGHGRTVQLLSPIRIIVRIQEPDLHWIFPFQQDYSKTRAWIWMKCWMSTDVGTWTNWSTFDGIAFCDIVCAETRNFITSGKSNVQVLGARRCSEVWF